MKMAFLFPCAEFFMLPKCPGEVIRPMFVPQFQPGLCEPANRAGTRGVGYMPATVLLSRHLVSTNTKIMEKFMEEDNNDHALVSRSVSQSVMFVL